jgi:hypothetical protein
MALKLEIAGIIPSKPDGQTIFEESYVEKETFNITTNFEEWMELRHSDYVKSLEIYREIGQVFDSRMANMIAPHFDGFMLAQAALVDGKSVVAKSRYIESIDDLVNIKSYLDQEEGKKYLLNLIYFFPRYTNIRVDETTFQPHLLSYPELTKITGWNIRYGVLA